jgi:4-amino-4-deoxy-L-arabinose transferase-like glycosyltransferase
VHAPVARNSARVPLSLWVISLIALLSCFRLAHIHLLWADEDYHIAAAIQILHGKIPYRDFWYDKPPLSALYYLLIGGYWGWPLRLLDAAYILAGCAFCYRLARSWWSETEAFVAALLFAFFTTFYLPSTVIPFAADALMILPHLAAIYFAARKQAFWAGLFVGIAFLANAKALFVLLVCAIWLWPDWLLLGIVIPTACGAAALYFLGAWPGYIEQVWRWGFIYAEGSPVRHPLTLGLVRTADWLGFQCALAFGAALGFTRFSRPEKWKIGSWLVLSFAAVCLGTRFAPHYFLQLLPGMTIAASPGIVFVYRRYKTPAAIVLTLCLLIPLIRFGPRYFSLSFDDLTGRRPNWIDVNLDLDSQDVARLLKPMSRPGDTLFVWGYRPDMYVYTRLIPPGLFWDSQPLTGVPADRHLTATDAIYSGPAAANRLQVVQTNPTWIIDGLGLLNPKLRPQAYPELKGWMSNYHLVARTKLSLIYRVNTR